MNNAFLMAVAEDGAFQIVGETSSLEEARDMADNYTAHGPDDGCIAPMEFQVHMRGAGGWYTRIVKLAV